MALTQVTIGTDSTAVLPAGDYKFIALRNDGDEDIRYSVSGGTPTTSLGLVIEAGDEKIFINQRNPSTQIGANGINAICASGGKTLTVEHW